MRHRLPWFIHPGAHGVGKGDEHPAYTPVTRYGTPLHRSPMNTYFGVAAGPYVVARTRRGLGTREGRTSSCGREPTVDGQPGLVASNTKPNFKNNILIIRPSRRRRRRRRMLLRRPQRERNCYFAGRGDGPSRRSSRRPRCEIMQSVPASSRGKRTPAELATFLVVVAGRTTAPPPAWPDAADATV